MKRLIIIGASGVIGGALYEAAKRANIPVIGTAHKRVHGDLIHFNMKFDALSETIRDLGEGDIVVLVAGCSSPSWITDHAIDARHVNVECSKWIVDTVKEKGAHLIFMSSDQVFDGESGGYRENDPANPKNFYGRLKVIMEGYVLGEGGIVVRTGWNVPWQEGEHCPVAQCYETMLKPDARLAADNLFNVSDVNDTANAIIAIAQDPKQTIYHLVSTPEVSRVELGNTIKLQSLHSTAMRFTPVPFSEIKYTEPRPRRAYLAPTPGFSFASPHEVIAHKTVVLDSWNIGKNVVQLRMER